MPRRRQKNPKFAMPLALALACLAVAAMARTAPFVAWSTLDGCVRGTPSASDSHAAAPSRPRMLGRPSCTSTTCSPPSLHARSRHPVSLPSSSRSRSAPHAAAPNDFQLEIQLRTHRPLQLSIEDFAKYGDAYAATSTGGSFAALKARAACLCVVRQTHPQAQLAAPSRIVVPNVESDVFSHGALFASAGISSNLIAPQHGRAARRGCGTSRRRRHRH